jgi:hypothetical protein
LHAIALLILQVKIVQKQVTAAKKEKRGTDGVARDERNLEVEKRRRDKAFAVVGQQLRDDPDCELAVLLNQASRLQHRADKLPAKQLQKATSEYSKALQQDLQQAHDTMCKAEARMASATLALKELVDRREAFDFEQQSDEELDRLVQQVDLAEEELEQGATPKVHNFCHACIFCSKLRAQKL